MNAQVTLTVSCAKYIIAAGIAQHEDFQSARKQGKILFKGGTTVSALTEFLGFGAMRISGRISEHGAKGGIDEPLPHSALYKGETFNSVDDSFVETAKTLDKNDVVVIGANALDFEGVAGILLGSVLGGSVGQGFSGIFSQGCKVLIACGTEKLIPGSILKHAQKAGRTVNDWSMGMSCGLFPLWGEVITEQTALELLFPITATPIAAGGIHGGEGSSTWVLEGQKEDIQKALQLIGTMYERVNNTDDNIKECEPGQLKCKDHLSCGWRNRERKLSWHIR